MPVFHTKVSGLPDGPNSAKVQPSNWDAAHAVSIGTADIADHAVTNVKAAQMAANTVKMNNTVSLADAIDATLTQFKTWLGLTLSDIATVLGVTPAADKLPYFTGSGTAGVADFTAAGRALIDDADATAQRNTLVLGTADTVRFGKVGSGIAATAMLHAQADAAGTIGGIVKGAASQTADLTQWQDSAAGVLSKVNKDGQLFIRGANVAAAINPQNAYLYGGL